MTPISPASESKRKPMTVAVRILAGREHSCAELRRKLLDRDFELQEVEETLARLTELSYVNDARFAEALVRHRVLQRGFGFFDARRRLRDAGIPNELAAHVLESAGEEIDEADVCRKAAEKKLAAIRNPEPGRAEAKLRRFLAGRGFEYDVIGRVLEDLLNQTPED